MVHKVMYSSARTGESIQDTWETPIKIFEQLNHEFGFTLDATASHQNALCEQYITAEDDALHQDWSNHVVFCNPPYSRLKHFAEKAFKESLKGATVVMLVPARTCSVAYHDYFSKGEIRFIRGRLKFLMQGEEQASAPFPSMLVIFDVAIVPKVVNVTREDVCTPVC
ncbi:phage N-6-adenine-methyltransferase [Vibrio harveyi]